MKCDYVKFFCKGGKLPTQKQTRTFINICSNFIENNPSQRIGQSIYLVEVFNNK